MVFGWCGYLPYKLSLSRRAAQHVATRRALQTFFVPRAAQRVAHLGMRQAYCVNTYVCPMLGRPSSLSLQAILLVERRVIHTRGALGGGHPAPRPPTACNLAADAPIHRRGLQDSGTGVCNFAAESLSLVSKFEPWSEFAAVHAAKGDYDKLVSARINALACAHASGLACAAPSICCSVPWWACRSSLCPACHSARPDWHTRRPAVWHARRPAC